MKRKEISPAPQKELPPPPQSQETRDKGQDEQQARALKAALSLETPLKGRHLSYSVPPISGLAIAFPSCLFVFDTAVYLYTISINSWQNSFCTPRNLSISILCMSKRQQGNRTECATAVLCNSTRLCANKPQQHARWCHCVSLEAIRMCLVLQRWESRRTRMNSRLLAEREKKVLLLLFNTFFSIVKKNKLNNMCRVF